MDDRDAIFRQRLVAMAAELSSPRGVNPQLRQRVGICARQLVQKTRARNWTDLKQRADGATYDSMLGLFQREAAEASKASDPITVKALEILGLSLVARRQYQADLLPRISFLDRFIEVCATGAGRASGPVVTIRPVAN